MNGLIFFVNIVKIYEPVFRTANFHSSLLYVISWLNLDLGIHSCFFNGMTSCQKIGLQFVFPLYLLSIVAMILVVCRAGQWPVFSSSRIVRLVSGKVSLLIGNKTVPVLSTLLLLSYTKFLRTTILIFHSATIIKTECTQITEEPSCANSAVWYVDGNIVYASGCHGFLLGIAGGIFSPLLAIFTAFLLLFPLRERKLTCFKCWLSWHMRLKPWYDSFGAPYKDRYRSWTGVLLLARCVLALVVAFENEPLINISALAWVCLFLISMLCTFQVYTTFLLNAWEIMYLVCLLLLAVFSTPVESQLQVYQVKIVVWIVLFSLLLIIFYHTYQGLKNWKIFHCIWKRNTSEQEVQGSHDSNSNNTVPSTLITFNNIRHSELREPLLENDTQQL